MRILWLGWSVSKYVCMSRVALFICISGTMLWNVIKLCMNINIGYSVILPFHDIYLRGQTKVAYIKVCYKSLSFICISRSIFWTKLCMNVNIGCAVNLPFNGFTSEVKQMRHIINMFLNTLLDKIYSSQHIERDHRDHILTSALYAVHTRV